MLNVKSKSVLEAFTSNVLTSQTTQETDNIRLSSLLLNDLTGNTAYSKDFSSLYEWAAFPAENKVFNAGEYDLPTQLNIVASNITIEGKVIINSATGISPILIGANTRTVIFTLTERLNQGIDFIYLPGVNLKEEDYIVLYNPIDYSYSSYRAYYRQGEARKIRQIINGVFYLDSGLRDSYPAGTQVIYMETRTVRVSGQLEINYPLLSGEDEYNAESNGLRLSQLINSDISNLSVVVKQGARAIYMSRCISINGQNVNAEQSLVNAPTLGLDYGLAITNCQDVNIDGRFSSERHGCCVTGASSVGAIVNRNIHISGEVLTTGRGVQNAADWHGNTEYCSYSGYLQGINVGGQYNTILPNTVVSFITDHPERASVLGAECKSIQHSLSKLTINNPVGNPRLTGRGVIDFGGNTNTAFGAYTITDGTLDISDTVINAPNAAIGTFIYNRGSMANYNINARSIKINGVSSGQSIIVTEVASAKPASSIDLTGFYQTEGMNIDISSKTQVYGVMKIGKVSIKSPWKAFGAKK